MPPFFAFSTNCSWAICEFLSPLGEGLSAGALPPPRNPRSRGAAALVELLFVSAIGGVCAEEKLHNTATVKSAPRNLMKCRIDFFLLRQTDQLVMNCFS